MLELLKYPYPYRAWITIASDPDNTLIDDWQELNRFIWEELGLPLANSLFITSHNANLPKQVNLRDYPQITSQKHDTIHTWGDYMHSREIAFDRERAVEAIGLLEKFKINPLIWIDHSSFEGNLLHNRALGGIPATQDTSGHHYDNYRYTLDLILSTGIRYIWDGQLTEHIGQDRVLSPSKYFFEVSMNWIKALAKTAAHIFLPAKAARSALGITVPNNTQYYSRKFPDGSRLYCFSRYGKWPLADIYGLAEVISKESIDKLIGRGGTMIVYTHLGKRPASKMHCETHIPSDTRTNLRYIKDRFESNELMISPASDLLDYLVLRDHLKWDLKTKELLVGADGIRYQSIKQSDLSGKKFSFKLKKGGDLSTLRIKTSQPNLELSYKIFHEEDGVQSITFL